MSKYLAKMKGSNSRNSALSPQLEDNVFIHMTSPTEDKFLPFKVPRVSEHPRKNKFRFQYKVNKSWINITNKDNSLNSPNSSLEYNSYTHKSLNSPDLGSRSAKIMKALSSTSFRNKEIGIRKLLNFDFTPSPESSSHENSNGSISTDTSNSSLTDSTDNNVPTVESIDENQNQTPQNRKHNKISSSRSNINEITCIRARTSLIMSLVTKEQKGRTDKNPYESLHTPWSFYKELNRPYRVTTSTPRNLSQEFNQEIHDRPRTPENMDVIPESDKIYCHEKQSFIRGTDVSAKNDELHLKTTTEPSGTDVVAETSAASESQKKDRNTKRTLTYNSDDKCSDIGSDCSMQRKTSLMGVDLLENGIDQIESDEMQDIDSSNCESHKEDMQVNVHFTNNNDEKEKDCPEKNVYEEEVNQLSLQEESGIYNVSATSENREASLESSSISQDANKVATPENNVNALKHMLTESIKKSHKKMKHGNRKKLFEAKDHHREMEVEESAMSLEDANNDQVIENQIADMICTSSPQSSEFNRPITPENINSSRLLLLNFNSVKKSHRKDKHSKRISSFAEYYDHKISNDSLQNNRYDEEYICKMLGICRNEFPGMRLEEDEESPILPKKKKMLRSLSLHTSTPKTQSDFISLGCKDIDDKFKIHTPMKKSILLTDYVSSDEMSQKSDKSAETTSNEIDCFRCETPVTRFKELRKTKELASKFNNDTESETDTSVLEAIDTDKDGASTPKKMSTIDLLHNIDSIKNSHKKEKHSRIRKSTSEKKKPYIQESKHANFTNEKMLEECTALSSNHHVNLCCEKEICSIHDKKEDSGYKETDYDDPQPSTSRGEDNIENTKNKVFDSLNATPPNNLNAKNFIKLMHTTSIKKSHKKERDMNAQTKYIFMSQEHELSDDGSIFDEEDRLTFMNINDNNTELITM